MAHSLVAFARDFIVDRAAAEEKWTTPVLVWETIPGEQKVITAVQFPGKAEAGSESVVFEVKKQSKSALVAKMPEVRIGSGGGNDVVLPDASVAASHAWLQQSDEGWKLVDGGGETGTFVDGRKLEPQTPELLTSGAKLKLGKVELLFLLPNALAEFVTRKLSELSAAVGSN